jgi:hypothetical protein
LQLTHAGGAAADGEKTALPVTVSQPAFPGPATQPHQLPVALIDGPPGSRSLASRPTAFPVMLFECTSFGAPTPLPEPAKLESKKKPAPVLFEMRLQVKVLPVPST